MLTSENENEKHIVKDNWDLFLGLLRSTFRRHSILGLNVKYANKWPLVPYLLFLSIILKFCYGGSGGGLVHEDTGQGGSKRMLKENVRRWVNKPCLSNSFIECGPHTQDSVTSLKPSRACWILLIALGNHWGYSAINRGVFHKWVLFSVTLENLSHSFLRKRVGSVCGS